MRLERATALLWWLLASLVLVLGVGEATARYEARDRAVQHALRAVAAVERAAPSEVDSSWLQEQSAQLGVDLILEVEGALVAEAETGRSGALVGAREGFRSHGEGTVAVRRAQLEGGRVVVAAAVERGERGGAPLLVALACLLVGGVLHLGLRRPAAAPHPPVPVPIPTPPDPLLARRTQQLAEERRRVELYRQFLRRLALELRTSVTAVIGYAELLKEEAQREERWSAASDVDRILVGARSGLDLVDDTWALTELESGESGRVEPSAGAFQLGTMLHDVVSGLRPIGGSLGTRIELESGEVGSVYTDQDRLRHVVRNLIARGLQAAPGGTIHVRAARTGSAESPWLRVDVRDDGPSLTPTQLDELFAVAPGEAGDTQGPGSSIGLVVARRYARLLGGELAAVASGEGGTVLTLQVPARLSPEAVDTALGASDERESGVEQ